MASKIKEAIAKAKGEKVKKDKTESKLRQAIDAAKEMNK